MEWLQPLIEKQAFLYLLGRWNIFTQDSHQTLGLSIEKGFNQERKGVMITLNGPLPIAELNWCVCVCGGLSALPLTCKTLSRSCTI